ncbi:MAG: glycosyltransferase [Patescibacteria group bacterium]
MKIALISSYATCCGVADYSFNLSEEFLKQKVKIKIFAKTRGEGESYDKDQFKKTSAMVERCWSNKKNYSLNKLYRALIKFKPDIIHFQDIFRREDGFKKIYQLFPGKIIVTFHSVNAPLRPTINGSPDKEFVKRIKKYSDYFIVHNNLSKKALIKDSGINKKKIKVIDHGTKLCGKEINKIGARKKINLPKEAFFIITYGFYAPKKGVDKLIELMPCLIKKITNLYYFNIGRVRLKTHKLSIKSLNDLEKRIRTLKLQKRVKLLKRFLSEEEVRYYLRASDLIILFYPEEYPLIHASGVAHEVIACGRPVIASDITTFSEFPNKSMYKIKPSKEALRRAILKIFKDKKSQKKILIKAREYSLKTSWRNTTKKHLKFYKEVLK